MNEWLQAACDNGWRMPSAPWWKRLPIIRHVRAVWHSYRAAQWQASVPGIPTGYDEWALYGMFHGLEASPSKQPVEA